MGQVERTLGKVGAFSWNTATKAEWPKMNKHHLREHMDVFSQGRLAAYHAPKDVAR